MTGEESGQALQQLLDDVELRDGWGVRRQEEDHLVIDYRPVPQSRLKRREYPGIDITDVGPIWWVGSADNIGEGFEPENEDTRLGEKSIDCADFEDAVALVTHGMEQVEIAVGDELREAHEPPLLPDGGDEGGTQNQMQSLVDGLRELGDERTPDDKYWCPRCEAYSVTEVLQPVVREEFGVENELWGCAECRYCFVPATEWRETDD